MRRISKVSELYIVYATVEIISKFAKWIARIAFSFSCHRDPMLSTTKLHCLRARLIYDLRVVALIVVDHYEWHRAHTVSNNVDQGSPLVPSIDF